MDALKKMQAAHMTAGLAVGSAFSQELTRVARTWFSGPAVPAVATLVAVVLGVLVMKALVSSLFKRQRWFRRLLLGNQYVEGTWFDVIRDSDGRAVEIGVSHLSYCDAEVRYSGDDYDLSMNHTAPFYTEAAQLKWDGQRLKLMYKYHAERSDKKDVGTEGYGELQFSPPGSRPNHYTGCYFVLASARKYSFEGNRLDERGDKEVITQLEKGDTKRDALRELLNRYGTECDIAEMRRIRETDTAADEAKSG